MPLLILALSVLIALANASTTINVDDLEHVDGPVVVYDEFPDHWDSSWFDSAEPSGVVVPEDFRERLESGEPLPEVCGDVNRWVDLSRFEECVGQME